MEQKLAMAKGLHCQIEAWPDVHEYIFQGHSMLCAHGFDYYWCELHERGVRKSSFLTKMVQE